MVKPSKKSAENSGKPITDFFVRKTLSQNGGQLQDSSQTSTTSDSASPSRLRSSSKKASLASPGTTILLSTPQKAPYKTRAVMDGVDVSSLRKTVKSQDENTPTISRKRSRSPDVNNASTHATKSRDGAKSPRKPVPVDDDNSGGNATLRRVIHVRPAPSKKKAKFASPEMSPPTTDAGSLVPSSQSDETEVTLAPQKIVNVDHWRKQALPISPDLNLDFTGDQMEVDVPETFHSAADPVVRVMDNTPKGSFTSAFEQMLTPPLTERLSDEPLPSSPVILDPDTKAAKIIAEIKAKAIASVISSPELLPSLDLDESPDDSSDEEEMTFSHFNKKVGTMIQSSPLKKRMESSSSGRYDLRNRTTTSRSSASRDQSPLLGRSTRAAPRNISKEPIISAKMNGKKKAVPNFNPLDAMLKEKRLAEKRGGDDKAFRLAEDVSSRFGKNSMLDEMAEEDDAELDDEAIAQMAVRERDRYMMKSSSPGTSTGSFDDILFNDSDGSQLLGDGRGKAIVGILEGDRQMSEEDKKFQKYAGISLWTGSGGSKDAMETNETSSTSDFEGEHLILELLKSTPASNIPMATLLLNTGILTRIVDVQPDLISCLSKTALLAGGTPLSFAAFRSLLHLFSQETGPRPGISFSSVLSTLLYLGADPSIIESAGWPINYEGHPGQVDADKREDILFRLLVLLQASANRLDKREIPDIVLAVLLVGMDSWTPEALQQDVINTLNAICLSIAPGNDIQTEIESAICNKALQFVANYEPVNKIHLVGFLSSGSGRTRRIASWLAHAILTDAESITVEQYTERPPLAQLISALTIAKTGSHRGKFELHEATDFVDLGFYISLLNVAICDVKGYVAEERSTARSKTRTPLLTDSPTKSVYEKEDTELLVVKGALERIHNKIIDTQAAHLDRTRTKACIKGATMRIHFQRQQFLNTKGASSLRQYFKSK